MRFRRVLRFWLSFWRPDPGTQGERLAARFLRRQGYRILARNLRSRQGEIDLVAEPPPPNQRILVIVEVKTRQADSHRCHRPEWRANHQKQQRLIRLAAALRHHRPFAGRPIRFDVLGVDLSDQGPPQIRHHPGAFQSPW